MRIGVHHGDTEVTTEGTVIINHGVTANTANTALF